LTIAVDVESSYHAPAWNSTFLLRQESHSRREGLGRPRRVELGRRRQVRAMF